MWGPALIALASSATMQADVPAWGRVRAMQPRVRAAQHPRALVSASDEELAARGCLTKTGSDSGIAKTAAVASLGAQLQAQANTRARREQAASFSGTVELHVRAGCSQCAQVRKALAGFGLSAAQLSEKDVDHEHDDAQVRDRVKQARESGVPQVYIIRSGEAGEAAERVNLWMELGSGKFQRRLQS